MKPKLSTGRAMVFTTLSALALPFAAIITGPLLSRSLGVEGRGAMAAALAPPLLAISLASLGLPSAVGYFVPRLPHRAYAVVVRGLLGSLIAGAASFAVIAALSAVLMVNFPDERRLLLSVAATVPISLAVEVARAAAQGLGRYSLQLCERWIAVVSRLLLIVILFATGTMTVWRATWVTWGTGTIGGLAYLLLLVPLRFSRKARSANDEPLPLYGYGLRTWAGEFAATLVLRLDHVLLGALRGGYDLGLYAVAVSVAEVPAAAIGSAQGVLISATADEGRRSAQITRALHVVVMLAVAGAIGGCLAVPVAIPLLFGAAFAPSALLAQILLIGSVFSAIGVVADAGLAAYGRPGTASLAQAVSLALTVPMLFLVIPQFGAAGAALTSAAAYLMAATWSVVAFSRMSGQSVSQLLVPTPSDVRYAISLLRRSGR